MMKCVVVTPHKLIFDGDVESVVIPSIYGGIGIHQDHAPLLTLLSTGRLKINTPGETLEYNIEGGFAEIRSNVISVLADELNDLDEESI